MATAKSSIQRRLPDSIIDKGLEESLPIGVQKGYFMLTEPERNVLNFALEKYRPGQSEPILAGGQKVLKPALRLAVNYRLVIEEIKDSQVITSYTRWVEAVQVRGTENLEVYLTFSPRFDYEANIRFAFTIGPKNMPRSGANACRWTDFEKCWASNRSGTRPEI
jgi:hypothetical protein